MTLTWFLAAFVGSIAFLALFLSIVSLLAWSDLRDDLINERLGEDPFNLDNYDGGTA